MPAALPPPVVVESDDQLRRMADDLRRTRRLAIDTESNSLHAYRERVCLIQLSTDAGDYLIDPLALTEVAPLGPLLADPRIETVFHAAEYDLICLWRDFRFRVAHLFDTRVAARTLGWPRTGLGDILEQTFGVRVDKRHQRADWGRRPLPPHLLDYARLDTHYLLPLRDRLADELEAAGRTAEAAEEFERLTLAAVAPGSPDDEEPFWRITHARRLAGAQAAVLRELHAMREAEAERRDCPPFKVMSDAALMAIAKASPRSRKALDQVQEVPARPLTRYAEPILTAVRRGLDAPPPRGHRPATTMRFLSSVSSACAIGGERRPRPAGSNPTSSCHAKQCGRSPARIPRPPTRCGG